MAYNLELIFHARMCNFLHTLDFCVVAQSLNRSVAPSLSTLRYLPTASLGTTAQAQLSVWSVRRPSIYPIHEIQWPCSWWDRGSARASARFIVLYNFAIMYNPENVKLLHMIDDGHGAERKGTPGRGPRLTVLSNFSIASFLISALSEETSFAGL